jgi:hypothetical protein
MPTKLVETGIEFPDATVQTTKAVAAVPQMQVITAPGTFSIPPSTTRVRVTVVGGSAGAPGSSTAGASGGTTSFGSYASATGGAAQAPGVSPASQLNAPIQNIGRFGAAVDVSRYGGYGVTTIDAPFPVTSVPVTVGAGGGGGAHSGAASGINGGPGQAGGGGAGGLSAPFQGTGSGGGAQPGAGPFARFGGGAGGASALISPHPSGEGNISTPVVGGVGGFQGIVIVEY